MNTERPFDACRTSSEDIQQVKTFFDHASIYQNLVARDYLGHVEIYAALHAFLQDQFGRPFSLFDLGCGDAASMTGALTGTLIESYNGVDISDVAIEQAKANMRPLECRKAFFKDDFLNFLQQGNGSADVIWIGLSLHHLTDQQKERFFATCARCLVPYGFLLVFDEFLAEGESRGQFVDRLSTICRTRWTALDGSEQAAIIDHVRSADFPFSVNGLERMSDRYGLRNLRSLASEPTGLYQLVSLENADTGGPDDEEA